MRFWDIALEVSVSNHLIKTRASFGVAQETLGEEEDKRLAEVTVNLATKDVEVVRWSRGVDNLHVAILMLTLNLFLGGEVVGMVITQLQETLNSAAGMLRALTIITVGEVNNQTSTLKPFPFASRNELVNDTLGVVGKVTELRFPDGQGIRRDE